MPAYNNINGVLRPVLSVYDNIDGVLHELAKGYDNINGVLREYHGAETEIGYMYVIMRWMAYYPGVWEGPISGPVGSWMSNHPTIIEQVADVTEYYGIEAYIVEEEDIQFAGGTSEELPHTVEIFLQWKSDFE